MIRTKAQTKKEKIVADAEALAGRALRMQAEELSGPNDLLKHKTMWSQMQWQEQLMDLPGAMDAVQGGVETSVVYPDFISEVFSRLYNYKVADIPEDEQIPEAKWAAGAMDVMEQMPEWKSMKENTTGESFYSGLGATVLAKALKDNLPEVKESPSQLQQQQDQFQQKADESQQQAQDQSQQAQQARQEGRHADESQHQQQARQAQLHAAQAGAQAQSMADPIAKAQEKLDNAVSQYSERSSGIKSAVRTAVKQAQGEVEETNEAAVALGAGKGDETGLLTRGDGKMQFELYSTMRKNKDFQKIMRMAGRMKLIADNAQATHSEHGHSEVTAVEQGNDIGRLLPSEIARLRNPMTKRAFMADFVEGKLMQYKLEGKAVVGKGPLVVMIDTSGSMGSQIADDAQRHHYAKAVALALLQTASKQKRESMVMYYNTGIAGVFHIEKNAKLDLTEMIEILDVNPGGGTRTATAMRIAIDFITSAKTGKPFFIDGNELPRASIDQFKKADIVMIGDGDDRIDSIDAHGFKDDLKEHGIRGYSVIIGKGASVTDGLKNSGFKLLELDSNISSDQGIEKAFAI